MTHTQIKLLDATLIDPISRTITEVKVAMNDEQGEDGFGVKGGCYEIMGGIELIEHGARLPSHDVLLVDEEGRLKFFEQGPSIGFFVLTYMLDGYVQTHEFYGKGLFLGFPDGENYDHTGLSTDEIKRMVTFYQYKG